MKLEMSDLEMEPLSPWCSPVRTRTAGLLIGIFDFLFLTVAFLKSVRFLQTYGFNFFATASVSCIGVLYSVHVLCILACWYGLARQKSSWLVPKIVLKITTVILCVGITLILAFFVSSNSPAIGNAIAHGFNAEYYDHRAVIDMACLVIVGVAAGLSMAQGWLLVLLVNIYRHIRAVELDRLCEKAIKKIEKKEKRALEKRSNSNGSYSYSKNTNKKSISDSIAEKKKSVKFPPRGSESFLEIQETSTHSDRSVSFSTFM